MKTIKTFNEHFNILNQSKVRNFPTYGETRGEKSKQYKDMTDFFHVFNLNKQDRGKYLNTWFNGQISKNKDKVYSDEKWTLKEVDDKTASHLYNRKFNPISLTIRCPIGAKFKQDKDGNDLYNMSVIIHSIDDSSYSVFFYQKTFNELDELRYQMIKWINQQKVINGDEFLNYAISIGADENSIDYN